MLMSRESVIIIIILSILATAIIGCMIFIGVQITHELKKDRKLKEITLYNTIFKNIDNIYGLLDSYINERFDEYRIFHQEIFQLNVLTDEQKTLIVKDLTIDVMQTMSPAFIAQLALVFNPDKDRLKIMINKRVSMAVIGFCLGIEKGSDVFDEMGN